MLEKKVRLIIIRKKHHKKTVVAAGLGPTNDDRGVAQLLPLERGGGRGEPHLVEGGAQEDRRKRVATVEVRNLRQDQPGATAALRRGYILGPIDSFLGI